MYCASAQWRVKYPQAYMRQGLGEKSEIMRLFGVNHACSSRAVMWLCWTSVVCL